MIEGSPEEALGLYIWRLHSHKHIFQHKTSSNSAKWVNFFGKICNFLAWMVAILENGRHFEILRGTRYFLNMGPKRDTIANVGACITIWKIVSVICFTIDRCGIRNKTHTWIYNFLKYCKQRVVIGGEHSTWTHVFFRCTPRHSTRPVTLSHLC